MGVASAAIPATLPRMERTSGDCVPMLYLELENHFHYAAKYLICLAPRAGFEPATNRLTAGCSTAELPGNSLLGVMKARI